MATESFLSCVHESWEILNVQEKLNNSLMLFSEPFLISSGLIYPFTIEDNATGSVVRLNAMLSLNHLDNLVLTISLNENCPNTSVVVRLHGIKLFMDGNEIPDSGGDSGVIELKKYTCGVATKQRFSDVNLYRSSTLKTMFILCNKIIVHQRPQETRVSEEKISKDFHGFCFQSLGDFETMLSDEATADVEIKVTLGEEKTFHCHKFILTARSPVFRAMFASQMKEADENVLVIKDISAMTMEHFLSFLYCGHFQNDSWINCLPNLTYVGRKYEVASLKELCNLHLIESVTCQNAVAVANLAACYDLSIALRHIKDFITNNSGEVNFDFAKASEGLEIGEL